MANPNLISHLRKLFNFKKMQNQLISKRHKLRSSHKMDYQMDHLQTQLFMIIIITFCRKKHEIFSVFLCGLSYPNNYSCYFQIVSKTLKESAYDFSREECTIDSYLTGTPYSHIVCCATGVEGTLL